MKKQKALLEAKFSKTNQKFEQFEEEKIYLLEELKEKDFAL
jgi:hypothetical protein